MGSKDSTAIAMTLRYSPAELNREAFGREADYRPVVLFTS